MDPFAIIIVAGFAALMIFMIMLGKFSGGGHEQLGWKSGREVTESREALEVEDLAQMLEAHNARRRRRGEAEVTVEELERGGRRRRPRAEPAAGAVSGEHGAG